MIKCPNCQGELEFEPSALVVKCKYCQTEFNPQTLETVVHYAKEEEKNTDQTITDSEETNSSAKKIKAKSFKCSQCGAELLTFDETAITFCSYCGSQAILKSRMVEINKPDYVIPFKITKKQAIEAYKQKINHSLFAPNYMKEDIVVDRFRGIYMPYCIYKAEYHQEASNEGSKYKKYVGDYEYYDDYDLDAQVDADFEGLSYDLVSKLYDRYTQKIPYNIKSAKKFNLNYLIGYYADIMDVEKDNYDTNAKMIMSSYATQKMSAYPLYREYGCVNPTIEPDIKERKIGMFPLYFLAIKNKSNGKIHYAMVNGETGKVAVDIPVNFSKYILYSILISIPIFLIINSFVFMLPKTVAIISVIISIISMIITNNRINALSQKEQFTDDIGLKPLEDEEIRHTDLTFIKNRISKGIIIIRKAILLFIGFLLSFFLMIPLINLLEDRSFFIIWFAICIPITIFINRMELNNSSGILKTTTIKRHYIKMPIIEKIDKYLYKHILAIIITLLVVLLNPVYDMYYYVASVINLIIIIISFYDLVKQQNILASNKLPQLEKRGGEENE